jgi:trimeric autotransporter adhesin
LSDTTIYVGGGFASIGGEERNNIAAINLTTGTATSWNPNASGVVQTLALSDTTIYVGGNFTSTGGASRNYIAEIDLVTGNATSWNPNASATVHGVETLALCDTTIYVGGGFASIGGEERNNIAAINLTTGTATSWNPDANSRVLTLSLSEDSGVIYTGGQFTIIGGKPRKGFAELDVLF